MTNNQQSSYAAPLLVIGCVVFGLGSLIVRFVSVGPYAIALWRLAIASVIFAVLARMFNQHFPRNKKAIRYSLLSGVFLAFDLALWHESIHAVGPGISTLLNSLQIFFLSAAGFFLFKERLSKFQIASLFIATIGVALIASPEFQHNLNAGWGFVSGIVSGSMLAMSMVCIRKANQEEPVLLFPMMFLNGLSGTLVLIIPSLILDWGHIMPNSLSEWGWVFIYGAVMQCFAWALIAFAIPLLSLSVTGLLLLSEPVAAILIDYFGLDKPIDWLQWLGVLLTLLAIYLGSQSKSGTPAH